MFDFFGFIRYYSVFVVEIGSICVDIVVNEGVDLSLDIGIIVVVIIFVDSFVLLLETLSMFDGFLGKTIVVTEFILVFDFILSGFLTFHKFISELGLLGFDCLLLLVELLHLIVDGSLLVILRLVLN